jgi:hypothetical protein
MPLPKPSKGEKEKDFIGRCMGDAAMVKEYPRKKQRAGVCFSQWRSVHSKAETESMFMAAVDPLVACGACETKFRPENEPEVAMGAVACPNCGTHVNQNGEVLGNKVTLESGQKNAAAKVKFQSPIQISNLALHDVGAAAQELENDPFAKLGYEPDMSKAYIDVDIVHTAPAIIGPVQEGFWCAYFARIVTASHGSLLHQQVNLNHLIKQYGDAEDKVSRDRIVGCVVATWFPPEPVGGWKIGDDPQAAPCIRAKLVIFKLAEGVHRLIGDHQASRKKQSVSIETTTTLGNLGIYVPSRGWDKVAAYSEWDNDKEIAKALKYNPLSIGKVGGDQAVFVYGMTEPVQFRGIGMTPRPAEREAKIVSLKAQRSQTADGGTLIAMAAELVEQELLGSEVTFLSQAKGRIDKVWREGEAKLAGMPWSLRATKEDPVLRVLLANKQHVLHPLSALRGRIAS